MRSVARSDKRVIIVGAGPVGLVCALALAQRDIPSLVPEAHSELFLDLRAGSFHPPTLEVLEACGVTKRLLEIGIVRLALALKSHLFHSSCNGPGEALNIRQPQTVRLSIALIGARPGRTQ